MNPPFSFSVRFALWQIFGKSDTLNSHSRRWMLAVLAGVCGLASARLPVPS
jgi:hypothetical protein